VRALRTAPALTTALALLSGCGLTPASSPRVQHLTDVEAAASPRILVVVAHPDDEIAFAGTLYKTSHLLGGACDVLTITNGEGGFKYSTLAESIYGIELTEEEVGRARLPEIREHELALGCELLGVRDLYLLRQQDHRYTQDPEEVLVADGPWDLEYVRAQLQHRLASGYDFVLTLAPTESTHGHHKAATLLALEAVEQLPRAHRPVVMCARSSMADEPPPTIAQLPGYGLTRIRPTESLVFDRTQKFGFRERLDYRIVANWAIAEHKSQGTMQLAVNRGDLEHYFVFDLGPPDAEERARALFQALKAPQFEPKTYETSAGTNALQ
jgi:LmbE family N-acetylglucosaminyl deacetylase